MQPLCIVHEQRALIAERVTAIALGYEDLNDHQTLRDAPVFCGDKMLSVSLRPSNIDAVRPPRAVLTLLVRQLRAAWPDVKITLRGDSGFCRWRLMR